MPEEIEAEERRALLRKAYAPGGGLTDAESRRLSELQDARPRDPDLDPMRETSEPMNSEPPPSTSSEPVEVHAEDPVDPVTAMDAATATETVTATDTATAPDALTVTEPLARSLRRHLAAVIAVTAVLLGIGIGGGWALFAPRAASIPLTEGQLQRRAELTAAVFDPASVRAIAQNDAALAWYATQDDGKTICLILDVGEQSQTECRPANEIENGVSATLPLPPEAGTGEQAGAGEVVNAALFLSTANEPIVALQRSGVASSILDWFDGADRERAEALVAEGYELGLSLAGRFRGDAVWVADRITEQGATERCLIVDAEGMVSCSPFDTALRDGLGIQVVDADPGGASAQVVLLELRYAPQQNPYLTITEAPLTEVGPGETVRIDAPPGDPIVVEPPGRDAER